ncbi:MAG: type II secretion system F family protein [Aeromicrobium sp.]
MSGAVIGCVLSAGLWLIGSGVLRTRRPSVEQRVLPYVRDVHPYVVTPGRSNGVAVAIFGPSVQRAAVVVGEWVGSACAVRSRLDRLGVATTLEEFRLRQSLWGVAGGAGGAAVATMLWTTQRTAVPILLGVCGFGFVAGVMGCDRRLSAQVTRREKEMEQEFPIVAELLALAVAAGESPVAGLDRILRVCRGSLADELARVLAEIRTGTPMAAAFDALARRTGVTSISRFAEGLAVALERGTPLVDVLHAQAADVRDAARRELMEAGGRKEVSMMIPVVFLVLPVTIVFAFYPGLVGLHLTSGT